MVSQPGSPQAFLNALRAIAALVILWHHFALYKPFADWAAPMIGIGLSWLAEHARATQVFFVIGGFVLAHSLDRRSWGSIAALGHFVVERYIRLGFPYLVVVALMVPIDHFARGWLPDEVLGSPVSVPQLLAHVFLLQDVLGYESLSAGFWFICINFQLSLLYVFMLFLRDRWPHGRFDVVALIGWPLSVFSLFYANLESALDDWFIYFFPYFFMGIVIQRVHAGLWRSRAFWWFLGIFCVALLFEWRWRLGLAAAVGTLLYFVEQSGYAQTWPRSRTIRHLGQMSYSLFLVHFPVLLVVSTLWSRLGLNSPLEATLGLCCAFMFSVITAFAFHRWVEIPATRLRHKRRWAVANKLAVKTG